MRKLTDIIKENESNKRFKYNATVIIEGYVYASDEGTAGELIDKEIDTIEGMVSYEIINIGADNESSEAYINPDLAIAQNTDINKYTIPKEEALSIIKKIDDAVNTSNTDLTDKISTVLNGVGQYEDLTIEQWKELQNIVGSSITEGYTLDRAISDYTTEIEALQRKKASGETEVVDGVGEPARPIDEVLAEWEAKLAELKAGVDASGNAINPEDYNY